MIRRIRFRRSPSPLIEDMIFSVKNLVLSSTGVDDDASLGVLVKYALNENSSEALPASADRIWDRLSRRVRSPFGGMAVEGPAVSGEELGSGHAQMPFSVGDEATVARPANSQETLDQRVMSFGTLKEAMPLS